MKLPSQNLLIFTILFLVSFWQFNQRWSGELLRKFSLQTTRKIDKTTLIIEELQKISQLNTVVFATESLIPTKAERKLGDFVVGTTELVYIAYGEVRAGINLQHLQPDHLHYTQRGLEIILPPPEILDSKIDIRRSQVYHYDRGFLALGPDVAPDLQTEAQDQALDRMVISACQRGILQQANLETERLVTQLLQSAGFNNFVVKTQKPDTKTCDDFL